MKTSELKKWLDENEWEYVEKDDYILIEDIKIYKKNGVLDIPNLKFGIGSDTSMLLQKALEYLETPISEREDEKKYNLKYNDTYFDFMDSWLVQKSDGKFWFSVFMKGEFTQQEIDNFPSEIKGAIECGFLKMFEVKE